MKSSLFLLFAVCLISCSSTRQSGTITAGNRLKLLSVDTIPFNLQFGGTTVGGLSGIDYNSKLKEYYLISDDRSAFNPARFYTAKIDIDNDALKDIRFTSVSFLKRADGSTYPNSKQDPYHTPDPEAMRYDARRKAWVWTSEGERIIKKDTVILENPSIISINNQGRFTDSFTLPSNLHMQSIQSGPRQNGVLEGLSFADQFRTLYVSVEEPLYQDGPRAGLDDSTGWIRIIKYDAKTRLPQAQYAYRIEAVAHPAETPGAFKINGVPDILWAGEKRLLVMERSFSTGRPACTIRLYLADLSGASDISSVPSLVKENGWKPAAKTLMLNLDSLGIYIDNIEGACYGPRLPNGHQSLVLISDNNFSQNEVTQFLLFEIE